MPTFTKANLPYVIGDTLIIPINAEYRHRYWDTDFEGRRGMTCTDLLRGLDREDLIPKYVSHHEANKLGINIDRPVIHHPAHKQVSKQDTKEEKFTLTG